MADHELTAAEIAWWAFATELPENWPPIYDTFGFETFEDIQADLAAALRSRGLTLELVSYADDLGDHEFRLTDENGRPTGRACIMRATESPASGEGSSGTAPITTPPLPFRDDPPFRPFF